MGRPKTRLLRAIEELREAAGERHFVLVIDKAHPTAARYDTVVHASRHSAPWQTLGLLHDGLLELERQKYPPILRAPPDEAPW